MAREKYKFGLVILLIILTLAPGCWDNRPLENHLIILGVAVDVAPQNPEWLLVTFGVPSSAPESQMSYHTFQGVGETMADAQRNINVSTYRTIRYGHTQILFFGEELAKQGGILTILDAPARGTEEGPLMDVAVCKGEGAKMLQAEFPQLDLTPLFYSDIIALGEKLGFLKRPLLWNFMRDVKEKGISATLPYLEYIEETATVKTGMIALFKEDKMIGIVSGVQAKILTALHSRTHKFGGTLMTTDLETGHKFAARPTSGEATIKVSKDEQGIKAHIEIEVSGDLVQFSALNVTEQSSVERIEQVLADYLTNQANLMFEKLQKEFKTDSVGIGLSVRAKYPEFFATVADDWDSYFVNIPISVTSMVDIESVGARR